MYDKRPNLNASDPHYDIPCGNSCFSFFTDLSCYPFGKLLSLILFINTYKLVPSITYKGSITLPLDFDILLPSESQTSGCKRTSVNGSFPVNHNDIITILATQKNKIS